MPEALRSDPCDRLLGGFPDGGERHASLRRGARSDHQTDSKCNRVDHGTDLFLPHGVSRQPDLFVAERESILPATYSQRNFENPFLGDREKQYLRSEGETRRRRDSRSRKRIRKPFSECTNTVSVAILSAEAYAKAEQQRGCTTHA